MTNRKRRSGWKLAAVALAGLAGACGPSFQAIYEGNARFEHCYALEENPQTPMPDKATCWRNWSERYTYGQTRDRVHYATARFVALSEARNIPTDEALMMAAPGETPRLSSITAPTPTTALQPPPKVLEHGVLKSSNTYSGDPTNVPMMMIEAGTPAPPPPPPPAPGLPSGSCSETCSRDYRGCGQGACSSDGGSAVKAACDACQNTYRACMRVCFK